MQTRKTWLPLALLSICGGKDTLFAQTDRKPNLVFVVVDDLGWGGFGPNNAGYDYTRLNQEFIRLYVKDYTPQEALEAADKAIPTLSALCRRGTRFTNAYATANVSSASRAGILTSCFQERFGYYINEEQAAGIPERVKLMPQVLQENGYATACIGKWHVGPESARAKGDCIDGYHPLDRGFDYYWGFNNSTSKYYDSPVLHKGREQVHASGYLTDELTREAIGFIDRSKDRPFMIYLAYNAMHGPLQVPAPAEYLDRFDYESPMLNNYYAFLYAVDSGIRRILEELRRLGLDEHTMIAFVSDNGAPGTKIDVLPKNGPLRGFKGQTWQGGVRIPMFIYAPGMRAGQVSDALVSTMDVFPTFMEYAGIGQPDGIDGRSLLPQLRGRHRKVRDYMIWVGQHAGCWGMYRIRDQKTAPGSFMVCNEEWSLRYDPETKRVALYDLRQDVGETRDVAAEHPARVEKMCRVFRDWYAEMARPMVWKEQFWGDVASWKIPE